MFNKTCMVVMLLISTIIFANEKQMKLNGADGPYIYHENGNLRVVSVDSLNKITDTITTKDTFVCEVENEDRDSFTFKLQNEFAITPSHYEKPKKMLAISDIEGNFNAFYSLLISNKVIDNNLNWVYGAGHLVLVGDFVDRGENVTQCLWLIYKLDYQSKQAGGQVHFILGNHEVMTFKARTRYIAEKYIALAQQVFAKEDNKLAYKELFSRNSELIRWMKTKNFIEKIGDVIFVHAGLSSDIMNKEMSFQEINSLGRKQIDEMLNSEYDYTEKSKLIFGRTGPLWYRGIASDYKYYDKIEEEMLDKILNYYEAKQIVIGHTIVDDVITTDFGNKVILLDIHHDGNKFSGKSQGVLFEGNQEFIVDDKGNRNKIK